MVWVTRVTLHDLGTTWLFAQRTATALALTTTFIVSSGSDENGLFFTTT